MAPDVEQVELVCRDRTPKGRDLSGVLDFPAMDVFKGVVKLMRRDRAQHVREIARIDAALSALGYGAGPRRHTMSAAARKKISIAQKARWAKAKKT